MATQRINMCAASILVTVLVAFQGSVAANFQSEMLNRINALEKQGQQQVEKMTAMESRIEEQDNRLAIQEKTISDYKQRVVELEHTVAVRDKTILDNKKRITDLEQTVAVQKKTILENKQRSAYLKQTVALQDRTIVNLKQKVAELEQTVSKMKLIPNMNVNADPAESIAENKQNSRMVKPIWSSQFRIKNALMSQRRALLTTEGPVAFQAYIGGGEKLHLGMGQKLIFPTAMTNVGGGYRNQHGIFTAPQPGIYIFSTSIMSDNRNHVEIFVDLMKNGQILAKAYAHGDSGRHDQGSVTVATQMATGDEVWVSVEGPADTSLYGGDYNSFMGCLVYPL